MFTPRCPTIRPGAPAPGFSFKLRALRASCPVVNLGWWKAVQPLQTTRNVDQGPSAHFHSMEITPAQRFIGRGAAHAGNLAPAGNACAGGEADWLFRSLCQVRWDVCRHVTLRVRVNTDGQIPRSSPEIGNRNRCRLKIVRRFREPILAFVQLSPNALALVDCDGVLQGGNRWVHQIQGV